MIKLSHSQSALWFKGFAITALPLEFTAGEEAQKLPIRG